MRARGIDNWGYVRVRWFVLPWSCRGHFGLPVDGIECGILDKGGRDVAVCCVRSGERVHEALVPTHLLDTANSHKD